MQFYVYATAFEFACCLRFHNSLSLLFATVVIIFSGNRCEHVQHHSVQSVQHTSGEVIAGLNKLVGRWQIQSYDTDSFSLEHCFQSFPIGSG